MQKKYTHYKIVFVIVISVFLIFTTFSPISMSDSSDLVSLKWTCDTDMKSFAGPVTKDIDGDGIHEIFIAGRCQSNTALGTVMCIDGADGEIIWRYDVQMPKSGGQCEPHLPVIVADLDNDGTFELVHSKYHGTVARNCEDGSIFWESTYRAEYHNFLVADTDENNLPYVYIVRSWAAYPNEPYGRVYKLNGRDGSLVATSDTTVRWCSYGGISIADLDCDGEYEILVTDRYGWGGKGVHCFTEDLTLKWNSPVYTASHCAVIADVVGDENLEVIALRQASGNGGIRIINADGSTYRYDGYLGLGTHTQPAVYDIDNDGNLELITSYNTVPKVWDLVDWKLDATLSGIVTSGPPDIANIIGDENMEIIACSGSGVTPIYDNNYQKLCEVPHSAYSSVVQDIDGDGLHELLLHHIGFLKAYDADASAPNPLVRSEIPYYSERRTATAEYIAPLGKTTPVENSPPKFRYIYPANHSKNIPLNPVLQADIVDPDGDLINWKVELFEQGDWTLLDSGTGPDGVATVAVESSTITSFNTEYRWRIQAIDPEGLGSWVKKTQTFQTISEPVSWCDKNWQYRKIIQIDSNNIEEPLSNFPVLISVDSDEDLADDTKCQPSGNDILFTDYYGTKLNHEIELFDDTSGNLIAWVNVTFLRANGDTTLYMYYGNPDAKNQQKPMETWDSHYVLVQHLNEQSGTLRDSSIYGNDGILKDDDQDSNLGVESIVGKGLRFEGDLDYIDCGSDPSVLPDSYTIEAWTQITGPSTEKYSLFSWTGTWESIFSGNYHENTGIIELNSNNYQYFNHGTNELDDNKWHHLAFTVPGTDIDDVTLSELFADGIPLEKDAAYTAGPQETKTIARIGLASAATAFSGYIDEFRISDIVRSDGWISASYQNQLDPQSFYTYGTEEVYSFEKEWQYKKQITIETPSIDTDLQNYPLLLDLLDNDLCEDALSDGSDILFTDQEKNKLSHEIEYYNGETGELVAWVNIPLLSNSDETVIFMYYGNPTANDQQNMHNTWDSHFMAVYHMNEQSGDVTDSTHPAAHGTPHGSLEQDIMGRIDGADYFDGIDDHVILPTIFTDEIAFTIETWIYTEAGARYFISQWADFEGVFLQMTPSGTYLQYYINEQKGGLGNIKPETWYHIVLSYDGVEAKLYVNGTTSVVKNASAPIWPMEPTFIGDRSEGERQFHGIIDDIRFSNIARSHDFIMTSFSNQYNPDGFYTIGSEELVDG